MNEGKCSMSVDDCCLFNYLTLTIPREGHYWNPIDKWWLSHMLLFWQNLWDLEILTYDPTNEEREHLTTALPSFFSKHEETDLNRNFGSSVEVEKYQDVDQHSYEHTLLHSECERRYERCNSWHQVSPWIHKWSSALLFVSNLVGSKCIMGGHRTNNYPTQFWVPLGWSLIPSACCLRFYTG